VVDDALLPEQTWERFETAFAPKVVGAWNLQLLTQHLPLDFFVLFSAGAGLLGSPGQANYAAANSYLDALAQYRRALGLPATTINWGAWTEVGMASRLDARQQRRLAEQGMGSITPDQGVRVLEQILLRGDVQTAVLPIQWPKLLKSLGETVPPFLSNFARLAAAPGINASGSKGGASDVSKSAVISIPGFSAAESLIAEIWGQVLGLEQFNLHDNFLDIGGNSLMAVEIITKIEARTGIRLDSASIYVKTLAQLAASIEAALPASEAVQPVVVETPATTPPTGAVEQETPIYFGTPGEPLYGMYHPPTVDKRDTAVVICPPWGQEFIRAHRACHQLAVRLSNAGFPVLRFDYYGTGDSGGNDGEHSISQSLRDIEAAIGEARSRSGARQVALIGWRLGAALAALSASQRDDLASVVLWDPIVNGSDYLQELGDWHRKTLLYYLSDAQSAPVEGTEFLGFAMSDRMVAELRQLDLLALNQALSLPVMLIERETQPATDALRARLEQLGASTAYNRVDAPQLWTENPDKALVPHQTLQAILSWMMEE
jgi:pimeloyl-ACP methyl ester carboxylesterase/acyl carrier protein